jgi:hypothetical protein
MTALRAPSLRAKLRIAMCNRLTGSEIHGWELIRLRLASARQVVESPEKICVNLRNLWIEKQIRFHPRNPRLMILHVPKHQDPA